MKQDNFAIKWLDPLQVVDVDKYYSEMYEKVSLQLAPLCSPESIAEANAAHDFTSTRTEGGGLQS